MLKRINNQEGQTCKLGKKTLHIRRTDPQLSEQKIIVSQIN